MEPENRLTAAPFHIILPESKATLTTKTKSTTLSTCFDIPTKKSAK